MSTRLVGPAHHDNQQRIIIIIPHSQADQSGQSIVNVFFRTKHGARTLKLNAICNFSAADNAEN